MGLSNGFRLVEGDGDEVDGPMGFLIKVWKSDSCHIKSGCLYMDPKFYTFFEVSKAILVKVCFCEDCLRLRDLPESRAVSALA